jgi:hypothetical protein
MAPCLQGDPVGLGDAIGGEDSQQHRPGAGTDAQLRRHPGDCDQGPSGRTGRRFVGLRQDTGPSHGPPSIAKTQMEHPGQQQDRPDEVADALADALDRPDERQDDATTVNPGRCRVPQALPAVAVGTAPSGRLMIIRPRAVMVSRPGARASGWPLPLLRRFGGRASYGGRLLSYVKARPRSASTPPSG